VTVNHLSNSAITDHRIKLRRDTKIDYCGKIGSESSTAAEHRCRCCKNI